MRANVSLAQDASLAALLAVRSTAVTLCRSRTQVSHDNAVNHFPKTARAAAWIA